MPTSTIFRAVNTQTDTQIANDLANGAVLKAGALGILADPGRGVGSASIYLDGNLIRMENVAPYALFADTGSDFFDIADPAGFNTALDLIGDVEETDGALSIKMLAGVQNPKLYGISVWESDDSPNADLKAGSISDEFVFV